METILDDVLTWSWFSEPHGYNFNGLLIRDPAGNLCIDPVEPTDSRYVDRGYRELADTRRDVCNDASER